MAKKNFYAVKKGRRCGIYTDWESCKAQVTGFKGAVFKGFETRNEAETFLGGAGNDAVNGENGPEADLTCGFRTDKSAVYEDSISENMPEVTAADAPDGIPALKDHSAAAYVDGSFDVNTGIFSCGVILFANADGLSIYHIGKSCDDPDLADMRNVAGEITGSAEAMKKSLELGIRQLTIYHDYEGIAAWCLGRWKTNKEGTRSYKAFYDEMSKSMHIDFVKVKGHSGDTYNELADSLAKQALKGESFNIKVK